MSTANDQGVPGHSGAMVAVSMVVIFATIISFMVYYSRLKGGSTVITSNDSRFLTLTVDKFLTDMEREKPIRFTSQQLRIATDNFTNMLGAGGFGSVYKGIFSNETIVAVKVLNGSSDKRIEEQFMAEVTTIGRVHHFNLVRLYGFCFKKNMSPFQHMLDVAPNCQSISNGLFK